MKRKVKLFIVVIISITLSFSLTGCWNSREMNSLAFITSMGFDKTDKGVKLTVQVLNPRAIASQKTVNEPSVVVYEEEGKDVEELIRKMITISSREMNLTHLQTVIFGEDYAKEGVSEVLDFILRHHQFRTNIYFSVAKGATANDVLNCLTKLDTNPTVKLVNSIETSEKIWAGTGVIRTVELVNSIIADGNSATLTGVEVRGQKNKNNTIDKLKNTKEDNLKIKGLAVLKKDKLVGWLNEDETKGYNYISGKVKNTVGFVSNKDIGKFSIEVTNTSSKTKVSFKNGKPKVNVKIHITANIETADSDLDITKSKNIKKIEKACEAKVKKLCNKSLKKAQKDLNSDIYGFGEEIHRTNPKLWDSIKNDWKHDFKDLPIDVSVKYEIIKTGTISKSIIKE